MPTQVQVRRGSSATVAARTLASGELDYNTTDKRLHMHDGSTAGGTPHANAIDVQNQKFSYIAATGTDTITAVYAPAPTAYAAGQSFDFRAQNTNTGAVTININSLGAKAISKVQGGAIVALEAGDIVQNAIYTIKYDGTQFLLAGGVSASPGALIKIETKTVASGTTLDFTGITTLYSMYKIILRDFSISSSGINMRIRFDGGSGFDTTESNYRGGSFEYTDIAGPSFVDPVFTTGGVVIGQRTSSGTSYGMHGEVTIYNNSTVSTRKSFSWEMFDTTESDSNRRRMGSGHWINTSTSLITGIRLFIDSGSFSSGKATLYGVTE